MKEALFNRVGNEFVPTGLAGSPWHSSLLHGGAPAGLLAFCLEQEASSNGLQPARLSIDLLRPVPNAPLCVEIRPLREGKRILLLEASLFADGKLVALASALFIKSMPLNLPDYAPKPKGGLPSPEQLDEVSFRDVLFGKSEDMPLGLHTTVRLRPASSLNETGAGCAWISLPADIIAGEQNSPFMLAALVSDFGNGVGQLSLGDGVGTINADIVLQLSRLPMGEWIGLECITLMDATGVGQVISSLYDERGRIGQVNQTVMPMPGFGG